MVVTPRGQSFKNPPIHFVLEIMNKINQQIMIARRIFRFRE